MPTIIQRGADGRPDYASAGYTGAAYNNIASTPGSAPVQTPATPATAYGLGGYDNTPDQVLSASLAKSAAGMAAVPDERAIYDQKLAMYQDQINAVNSLYANKLAEQQKVNANNTGQGTAIQARSGVLGSDFGQAQSSKIENANMQANNSINQEEVAAIQTILGQARQDAAAEIASKRAAQQSDTANYLTYLNARTTRAADNAKKVASSLFAQKIDPTTTDQNTLTQIAKQYGISVTDITDAYRTLAQDAAKEQAALAKDKSFTINEGESRYAYNPATDKYELIASKAKTYAPKAGSGGSSDPDSPLTSAAQAVLANPSILKSYTPTRQGQILDELASHGSDLSAFGLNDPSGTQRDNIAKYDDLIRNAANALDEINTGNFGTGPLQSRYGQAKQVVGNGNINFTDYSSAISNMSSILLNLRSGAAVTPSEAERLAGFIPSITDQENVVKEKIAKFNTELAAAKKNYTDRATASAATLYKQNTAPSTVQMSGPGGTFNVPADKVGVFIQNGYKQL